MAGLSFFEMRRERKGEKSTKTLKKRNPRGHIRITFNRVSLGRSSPPSSTASLKSCSFRPCVTRTELEIEQFQRDTGGQRKAQRLRKRADISTEKSLTLSIVREREREGK